MEVVVASSSVDAGVGCWDLHTGAEKLRYKSCASPPHGLVSVGQGFLASSQLKDSPAAAGSIFYWSWSKPQVDVKSFPAEQIIPLAANHEGTYLVGGGLSGEIYLWEVASGKLLKKWRAHYRAVSCLVFSEDDSLLISGSQDGSVRVWSLFTIFDDLGRQESNHLYEYSFSEHTLRVTDVVIGYGGSNAIIVSASEDRTCKVWSLSRGTMLRNIAFTSIIDTVVLDPAEHVFYAGSRDGKIFIASLHAETTPSNNYGAHIMGAISNGSKSVTCLAYCTSGNLLLSGSEDGIIRAWDVRTHVLVRTFKHAKGPVNNILFIRQQPCFNYWMSPNPKVSSRKQGSMLPPPLERYTSSRDEDTDVLTVIHIKPGNKNTEASYLSSHVIANHIKELQHQGSAAASELEIERLKLECKRSVQSVNQWKKMFENLHQFCVNELVDGDQEGRSD